MVMNEKALQKLIVLLLKQKKMINSISPIKIYDTITPFPCRKINISKTLNYVNPAETKIKKKLKTTQHKQTPFSFKGKNKDLLED